MYGYFTLHFRQPAVLTIFGWLFYIASQALQEIIMLPAIFRACALRMLWASTYNSGFLMTLASHRATYTRQSIVEHHSVSSPAAPLSLLCLWLLRLLLLRLSHFAAAPLLLRLSLLCLCCCASLAAASLSLLCLSLLCLSHCWRRLSQRCC